MQSCNGESYKIFLETEFENYIRLLVVGILLDGSGGSTEKRWSLDLWRRRPKFNSEWVHARDKSEFKLKYRTSWTMLWAPLILSCRIEEIKNRFFKIWPFHSQILGGGKSYFFNVMPKVATSKLSVICNITDIQSLNLLSKNCKFWGIDCVILRDFNVSLRVSLF